MKLLDKLRGRDVTSTGPIPTTAKHEAKAAVRRAQLALKQAEQQNVEARRTADFLRTERMRNHFGEDLMKSMGLER